MAHGCDSAFARLSVLWQCSQPPRSIRCSRLRLHQLRRWHQLQSLHPLSHLRLSRRGLLWADAGRSLRIRFGLRFGFGFGLGFRFGSGLGSGLGLWQGLGLGLGLGLWGLDRRVLVLLEHPRLDVGERRDHALGTAEAGPALVLRVPAVLDQLGQAWLGMGLGLGLGLGLELEG